MAGNLFSCDAGANKIYKHDGFTTTVTNSFSLTLVIGVAWEGTNLIACEYYSKIFKYQGFSSTVLDSFDGQGSATRGVGWDSTNVLHSDDTNNHYVRYVGFSGSIDTTIYAEGTRPTGGGWDGANLLSHDGTVANDPIYQHDGFTTTILDSFAGPSTATYGQNWDSDNLILADDINAVYIKYTGFSNTVLASIASEAAFPTGTADDSWSGAAAAPTGGFMTLNTRYWGA